MQTKMATLMSQASEQIFASVTPVMEAAAQGGGAAAGDAGAGLRAMRRRREAISTAGTHLGHNIPDERGNRWCINLCSVAHMPPVTMTEDSIRAALRRRS